MLEPSEDLENTHTISKKMVHKPEEVHLQSLQHVRVLTTELHAHTLQFDYSSSITPLVPHFTEMNAVRVVLGGYGGTPSGDPKERLRATEWLHSFQRRDDAWSACVAGGRVVTKRKPPNSSWDGKGRKGKDRFLNFSFVSFPLRWETESL
ncbi:unnamed protein product [Ectocarpus sp. CCAP 1310/34]|nr:unnamed protein product [Ectocarpus sp. CCAP 1310/34]